MLPDQGTFDANSPQLTSTSRLAAGSGGLDNGSAGNPANNPNAINPFRLDLDRSQAPTCDQDHHYGHEQQAFDQGLMDLFPLTAGSASCNATFSYEKGKGLVMGYFESNTVTALWNYAPFSAIGRGTPVIVGPSLNAPLLNHPEARHR